MKLELSKDNNRVTFSHNGEADYWETNFFRNSKPSGRLDNTPVTNPRDIFYEINGYWEQLPHEHQQKIFNVYKRIAEVFNEVWQPTVFTNALYQLVGELMDLHNLDHVKHWVIYYSGIQYPPDLMDDFSTNTDYGKTSNRTYTKGDYQGLAALAVILRTMFPIWTMYINRTKDETGNLFKEYSAVKLLSRSYIYHSDPVEKLRVYLAVIGNSEKTQKSAPMVGLSTSDVPEWLLGVALVRKLSNMPLSVAGDSPSIIAAIYNYINHRIGRDGGFTMGDIHKKIPDNERQDNNQKLSVLENYKIKEKNPAGDTISISVGLRRQEAMLFKLEPDIDPSLLKIANGAVNLLSRGQIREPQILLISAVLQPLTPHQGNSEQILQDVISAAGVAVAILWHRRFYELAGLVSATGVGSNDSNSDEYTMTTMEGKSRITSDQFEELSRLFPYSRRSSSKQRSARQANVAVNNIDNLTDKLSKYNWMLNLPPEWVEKVTGHRANRQFILPNNIRIRLADFVIDLERRKAIECEKMLNATR